MAFDVLDISDFRGSRFQHDVETRVLHDFRNVLSDDVFLFYIQKLLVFKFDYFSVFIDDDQAFISLLDELVDDFHFPFELFKGLFHSASKMRLVDYDFK